MQLKQIQVRNYRSYVVGQGDPVPTFDISEGLNFFVGPNNCGKSNLFRAVALALEDWTGQKYDAGLDNPSQLSWANSIITLTFLVDRGKSVEKTLLKMLRKYEKSVGATSTFADNGEIRFRVAYGKSRNEMFLAKGRRTAKGNEDQLQKCIDQFRKCFRFVYLRSGEGIRDFLRETLHEILETVLKEHLRDGFAKADEERQTFLTSLETGLLHELSGQVHEKLQFVVGEIDGVTIEPSLPLLGDMLSSANIRVKDSANTALLDKGTGIRGVLLVSLLRYLCEHSRRSMILAIEEPESFLHPEAQLGVRDALADLAKRKRTSVLVTTHSSTMLDRDKRTQIMGLRKAADGRTETVDVIQGSDPHTQIIQSLYGNSIVPAILEMVAPLQPGVSRVLFVEGYSDKVFIEKCTELLGKEEFLKSIEIRYSNGAHKAAMDALLLSQMVDGNAQIGVLLDYDGDGKSAKKLLKDKFQWLNDSNRYLFEYRAYRPGKPDARVEAEDMFSAKLLEGFVRKQGESVIQEKEQYPDGTFHFGFTQAAKDDLVAFVEQHAKKRDVALWNDLLTDVEEKFEVNDL